MAGLPAWSAIVFVQPPLYASGLSLGSPVNVFVIVLVTSPVVAIALVPMISQSPAILAAPPFTTIATSEGLRTVGKGLKNELAMMLLLRNTAAKGLPAPLPIS